MQVKIITTLDKAEFKAVLKAVHSLANPGACFLYNLLVYLDCLITYMYSDLRLCKVLTFLT